MPKQQSLIDQVREEFEDALITNSLLAEMNATGGLLIPRAIMFNRSDSGDWHIRISGLQDPPSIANLDRCRAEVRAELQEHAAGAPAVACLICPAAFQTNEKTEGSPGMAVLAWTDMQDNQYTTIMRSRRNGETFDTRELTQEMWDMSTAAWAKKHPDAPDPSLSSALVDRLTPTLTEIIYAAIPEASREEDSSIYIESHGPFFTALKTHATTAVGMALQLAEVRADSVLGHMVMTVNYLREQNADLAEKHQEELTRPRRNQERQQSKAATKLQRELEMSRKRADTLTRQLQEARAELRSARPSGVTAAPAGASAPKTLSDIGCPNASPLHRRLRSYLRKYPVFNSLSALKPT